MKYHNVKIPKILYFKIRSELYRYQKEIVMMNRIIEDRRNIDMIPRNINSDLDNDYDFRDLIIFFLF